MGKAKYAEGATASDKKHFAKYLAEDEELVVATEVLPHSEFPSPA